MKNWNSKCPAMGGPCACTGACLVPDAVETQPLITSIIQTEKLEPIYLIVGERIAECRNFLGMSQEELAKRVGLSRASIANIETGRQRLQLHDVERFCGVFGMTYQRFMRGIWFIDGRKP